MSIDSNFNKNLKTSVRKHSNTLPSSNKFLLRSLLKNLDEVENMLEDDNLVEYKKELLSRVKQLNHMVQ